MKNNKTPRKLFLKIAKWIVIFLVCFLLVNIAYFFMVFSKVSSITSILDGRKQPQQALENSPFTIKSTPVLDEKSGKSKPQMDEEAKKISDDFIEKHGFGFILPIFTTRITHVDLCELRCDELSQIESKINFMIDGKYALSGTFSLSDPPVKNPAFQLTALLAQTAFGQLGYEVINFLSNVTKPGYYSATNLLPLYRP